MIAEADLAVAASIIVMLKCGRERITRRYQGHSETKKVAQIL